MKEEIDKRLGRRARDSSKFMQFAYDRLENYKRRGQTGTHKNYKSNLRKFQAFLEDELDRKDIHFERITDSLIRDFRTYCYEVRGNKTNTVGKALTVLRTFVRKAMKEGHIDQGYPFEHITVDNEKVEREKLTPEEIERIADVELDPDSLKAEVRRWFLFAYYAGGMRFSDVATLKPEHIRSAQGSSHKRIYYRMEKTEGMTGVPVNDEAQAILDYYDQTFNPWVFPILKGVDPDDRDLINRKEAKNTLANKYLRKYIAPKAGIEKHVSFHLSRNAAAWKLYETIGDIYKVMKILGHSSVQQTEEYISGFEDDSLDDDFLDAL
jgi:integrase